MRAMFFLALATVLPALGPAHAAVTISPITRPATLTADLGAIEDAADRYRVGLVQIVYGPGTGIGTVELRLRELDGGLARALRDLTGPVTISHPIGPPIIAKGAVDLRVFALVGRANIQEATLIAVQGFAGDTRVGSTFSVPLSITPLPAGLALLAPALAGLAALGMARRRRT